jgi:hypothetical protein
MLVVDAAMEPLAQHNLFGFQIPSRELNCLLGPRSKHHRARGRARNEHMQPAASLNGHRLS